MEAVGSALGDMTERRYNEISLADQRAELEKAMEQALESQQQQPMPVDDSQCDWSEPVTEVTRGGNEVIAGKKGTDLFLSRGDKGIGKIDLSRFWLTLGAAVRASAA